MATSDSDIGETAEQQCNLLLLYLQDVSFEAPHVPAILFGHQQPTLEFAFTSDYTLNADASSSLGAVYAVGIRVTVKANAVDKTMFLIEARQCGLFEVVGYPAEELDFLLRTKPVATLFPFCRELITSLVSRAGFPHVKLKPINFETEYARARREHDEAVRKAPGNA